MARLTDGAEPLKCSFCGKSQKQVCRLIGDSGAYTCDGCIELCNEVIEEELGAQQSSSSATPLLKPREINEFLNTWVIGQDRAKRALSAAVYSHYKRVCSREVDNAEDMLGTKSNILPLGPAGMGKIHLARCLARPPDVSSATVDATALTEAGYVGEDVENILLRPVQEADGDTKKVEEGIIYVDEIDKVGRKVGSASTTRDVSGEDVQQVLLRIVEDTVISVPPTGGCKHPHQQFLEIDTSGILFIAAGAFTDIEDTVKARLGRWSTGFGSELKSTSEMGDLYEAVSAEDLHKFGMTPELIGRFSTLTSTKELTEEGLVRALTEPSNPLVRQYQHLFELDNTNLEFTHEVLLAIAVRADERKTGARGLSLIMEQTLSDLMFDLPNRDDVARVVITRGLVEGVGPVELYPRFSSEGKRSA